MHWCQLQSSNTISLLMASLIFYGSYNAKIPPCNNQKASIHNFTLRTIQKPSVPLQSDHSLSQQASIHDLNESTRSYYFNFFLSA